MGTTKSSTLKCSYPYRLLSLGINSFSVGNNKASEVDKPPPDMVIHKTLSHDLEVTQCKAQQC